MNDDIQKTLDIIENEEYYDYIKDSGYGDIDEDDFEEFIKNHRQEFHDKYFSYLDKYVGNEEFYSHFTDYDIRSGFILIAKVFHSDELYNSFIDYIEKIPDLDRKWDVRIFEDVDELKKFLTKVPKDYDFLENLNNFLPYKEPLLYLYYTNPLNPKVYEMAKELPEVLADQFLRGNYNLSSENINDDFVKCVIDRGNFSYDDLCNFILTTCDKNVSVLKDNNLVRAIYENVSKENKSRVLALASKPTKEMIDEMALDITSYKIYDGSYKNSPYLLHKFLLNNQYEAILAAFEGSLSMDNIEYLKKHDFDLSMLLDNEKLRPSFLLNKELVKNGNYKGMDFLENVLNDDEKFDYVVDFILLHADYKCSFSGTPDMQFLTKFIREHINISDIYSIRDTFLEKSSSHVITKLMELGLDFEYYAKNSRYLASENVINEFIKKGDYRVLLFSFYPLTDELMDHLPYELYLDTKSKYFDIRVTNKLLCKYFLEGHYDVIDDFGLMFDDTLENLHLNNLSYEEYLKLPEKVREIPALKVKYIDHDPSYLRELFRENPTYSVINKMVDLDILTWDDVQNNLTNTASLPFKAFLKFGKEHKEVFKYYYSGSDEELEQLTSLYYDSFGNEPYDSNDLNPFISVSVFKRYLADHKFEAIKGAQYLYEKDLLCVFDYGYNFEIFKKYPIYNSAIFKGIITKDNCYDFVNFLMEQKNSYFKLDSEFIVYLIRNGYPMDICNSFLKTCEVSLENLIDNLKPNEYYLLNDLVFKQQYFYDLTKKNALILVKSLTEENLEKHYLSGKGMNTEVRNFINSEMIKRGHYDFIKYYSDTYIPEELLKMAILKGYFPKEKFDRRDSSVKYFLNVSFSKEEIEKIRSLVDDVPYLAIYIPNILEDINLASRCMARESELIYYLKPDANKFDLITKTLKMNPSLVENVIRYYKFQVFKGNLSSIENFVFSLINANNELIKYINFDNFSSDFINKMIAINPNMIDNLSSLNFDMIKLAIDNGYKLTKYSSSEVFKYYLIHNIDFDIKLLEDADPSLILNVFHSISYDTITDSLFKKRLNDVLYYFYNKDSKALIYKLIYYGNNLSCFNAILDLLNLNYDDIRKYYGIHDYDEFAFLFEIDRILKVDRNLDTIGRMLVNHEKTDFLKQWVKMYLPNEDLQIIAHKYFVKSPLFFIDILDTIDEEILSEARMVVDKYPSLVLKIPELIDTPSKACYYLDIYKNVNILPSCFLTNLEVFKKALEVNAQNIGLFDFLNEDIRNWTILHIVEYPSMYYYVSSDINDKETLLTLIKSGICVYANLTGDLRYDFDIVSCSIENYYDTILRVPKDMPRLDELILKEVKLRNTNYIYLLQNFCLSDEVLSIIINNDPNIIKYVPASVITLDMLKKVNLDTFSFFDAPFDILNLFIKANLIDLNNPNVATPFINAYLRGMEGNSNVDIPFLTEIFNSSKFDEILQSDQKLFKKIIAIYSKFNIDVIDESKKAILDAAITLLNSIGKVNTLDRNPTFSYDLIKYVLPTFGIPFTKDLIKYNTDAVSEIISELKLGNKDLLLRYYDFICKYNVFPDDSKRCHFAFRYFKNIKELAKCVIDVPNFSFSDVRSLKNVILRGNPEKIETYAQLIRYNDIRKNRLQDIQNMDDACLIKNIFATVFGYNDWKTLEQEFRNFQLDNFTILNACRKDIKTYYKDSSSKILEKCSPNKNELMLIMLMRSIINSEDIDKLKEIAATFIRNNEVVDYSYDVQEIIRKYRLLFNYQFNTQLSDIKGLEGTRISKDDKQNPYGVDIISMDSLGKLSFLAHRIYSYDTSMHNEKMIGFKEMLENDPSLWTQLEGATTLSTSAISDKGFWFLHSGTNEGVVYLFNKLPENFMLFMYGRDLCVEHGGYRMEPTATSNSFTTFSGLSQASCYRHCTYNEVAGYRDGMMPCAILMDGDVPNETSLRAAKYFSVPLIKVNIPKYDAKKVLDYSEAKKTFESNMDLESIKNIFINGLRDNDDSVSEKVEFCLNVLNEKYQKGVIDRQFYLNRCIEILKNLKLICADNDMISKEVDRLTLFIDSFSILTKDKDGILTKANMGESGVMYKFENKDGSYLVKPGVRKDLSVMEGFRSEIMASASVLQSILSPNTSVLVSSKGKKVKLSSQALIDVSKDHKDAIDDWAIHGGELDKSYVDSLLQEYVVDFLLCNFDCFSGNFIIDSNNQLRGIDKEQSFRFIDSIETMDPSFSYTPNGMGRIPIYKIMFERYKDGKLPLDLSIITDTIEKAKDISDEDYKSIFINYTSSFKNGDELMEKIIKRKNDGIKVLENYVTILKNYEEQYERGKSL